ncbi:MAG: hypothetical protein RR980_01140, partial [Mucinivorans sp.]
MGYRDRVSVLGLGFSGSNDDKTAFAWSRLRKAKFSRAVKKSEVFKRAVKQETESLGIGSEKRSFSQKVLGDFFTSHDS